MTNRIAILEAKLSAANEEYDEIQGHIAILQGFFYEVGETKNELRSLRGKAGQLRNKIDHLRRELAEMYQMRLPGFE